MLVRTWQREGVDTRGVAVDPDGQTGVHFVTHEDDGHVFSYLRTGSAASRIVPADIDADLIRHARFLHATGISQAISDTACDTVSAAIDMAREAGVAVCYDANLRPALWPLRRAQVVIRATIALCNFFLPSLDDARAFTGLREVEAILDWCHAAGAKTLLLKLGVDGVRSLRMARDVRVSKESAWLPWMPPAQVTASRVPSLPAWR